MKTNFIATDCTERIPLKTSTKRQHQECNIENVVVSQMQICVDFEIIDPKITEEMVITDLFGTSGINKYYMTLKDKGMESFSCIIKILDTVIIQPYTGKIQEQTHKKHSVTRTIKSKQLLEDVLLKSLYHSHCLRNLKSYPKKQ